MKENSEKKRLRTIGVVFLITLLIILSYRIVKDGIFSNKFGINLAVVGDDGVNILILRPDEEILGVVSLPEKLKIKIYNSTAQYPVGSLWEYGISEKKPYDIFQKSLGLSMGVAIPRTIKIKGKVSLEQVLSDLLSFSLKTNLTLRDRFLIRQYLVESVASKKVLEMDVPNNALDDIVEPDGKDFLVFNNVISLWTKNKFILESILNENANVSINNLSGLSGQGYAVSRQMESAGIRVVEVKTDPLKDIPGEGCFYLSHGKFPITEDFLSYQIGCKRSDPKINIDGEGIDVWLK